MLRSLYTNVGFVWARNLGVFCLACNGIAILLCRSRICQESDTVTPKNLLWTNLVQIKDQFEF